MRILLMGFLILISVFSHAKTVEHMQINARERTVVFVSFSMPHQLLIDTLKESTRLHIPAVLNGLVHHSMPETLQQILALSKEIPNLKLDIDPRLFEKFSITKVPAVVRENHHCFDVIYGNITVSESLERIHRQGECR